MMLIEETTVPESALPVEEFKAHLQIGTGFGQDQLQDEVLASFLRAAMAAIEARTGKILIVRTFSWTLTFWRDQESQGLPVAPVLRILRVARIGRDGSQTDVAAESYRLERDSQRPRLRANGASLPQIAQGGAALIEFEAGYGATWPELPADLRQAVLLLAAHYYEFRNETSLADGNMPFGVASLIERFRILRMGSGSIR